MLGYNLDDIDVAEEVIIDTLSIIEIPSYVKEKAGCEFEMILFEYIPSENWLNYFDEKYRLEFGIDRSNSIKQVQLQIKNSDQQAFVDLKIDGNFFSRPLSQMACRDAWKDIHEICFTVFADEDCKFQ